MEDVLDVYQRPHDLKYPTVCFDETSKQLIEETRVGLSCRPGSVEKYDYEYRRKGTRNLFMMFSPLSGWRNVKVTKRRTKADWAECMRELVEEHFPKARKVAVVQDNLNTHDPVCLYEFYEAQKAKEILDRLEFHYTPKHGSWLNMAEIEFSVLMGQCLDRRIGTAEKLIAEVQAWEVKRNGLKAKVDWRFTASDARIKLKRLYPLL